MINIDEVYELIKRAQSGDRQARERLVSENAGLVWSIVKKFQNRGYEQDDLFQIGSIGLLKCIEKFDTGFNVRFSTYAVPMIIGEIKRFLRDDGMIKVSRPLKELSTKAKYLEERLSHETGRSPTIDELASALDTPVEELVIAMESGYTVESLYQTANTQDGSQVYLLDKLDAGRTEDDSMVDMIALRQIINCLPPRERQVILLRYFQDKTQNQVAEMIGVSQVQVSRIEKKVLQSIREQFA